MGHTAEPRRCGSPALLRSFGLLAEDGKSSPRTSRHGDPIPESGLTRAEYGFELRESIRETTGIGLPSPICSRPPIVPPTSDAGRSLCAQVQLRVGRVAMLCGASGIWRRMGNTAEPRVCGSPASFRSLGCSAEDGKSYPRTFEWVHRRWRARIQRGTLSPVASHGLFGVLPRGGIVLIHESQHWISTTGLRYRTTRASSRP
jgi:hypothetical protein